MICDLILATHTMCIFHTRVYPMRIPLKSMAEEYLWCLKLLSVKQIEYVFMCASV